ncbi:MAG: hypothetical protein ABI835_12825, partial [Chloroflexota bacterium]
AKIELRQSSIANDWQRPGIIGAIVSPAAPMQAAVSPHIISHQRLEFSPRFAVFAFLPPVFACFAPEIE